MTKNQLLRRALWEMVGFIPHPKQEILLDSDVPIKAFVAGTKAGKTYSGIHYALDKSNLIINLDRDVISGAIIAPTLKQCRLAFEPICLKLRKMERPILVDWAASKGYIKFLNLQGKPSEITIYSTDDPKTLFGPIWDWGLVDEGAQMPDNIYRDYIESNIRDMLLATTPESTGTWVEDIFWKGQAAGPSRYFSINLDTFSNTKMPGYSPDGNHTGDYLDLWLKAEAIKNAFPETYNRRYMGKFTISDRGFFRHLDACVDDNLKWDNPSEKSIFTIQKPKLDGFYSKGVDLARLHDRTVIWVFDLSRTLVYLEILENTEWDIQEQRIKWVNDRYPGVCQIDATGVGDRVRAALQKLGIVIDPIVFNRKGTTHSTMKDEILAELVIRMANTDMRLPRIPEVINDFRSVRISQTKAGREVIGDGSGHLPDTVSAAALAIYGLKDLPSRYQIEDEGGSYNPVSRADGFDEITGMPFFENELVETIAGERP